MDCHVAALLAMTETAKKISSSRGGRKSDVVIHKNKSYVEIGMSNHYCDIAPPHPIHGPYHDHEYGVPTNDDTVLFERLILEIFQAGLSWETILKKRQGFKTAFLNWDIEAIARMDDADKERLLNNPGIIRNRLKINATIYNANVVLDIQKSHQSFANWLESHHPRDKAEWVKLMRKTFKFMGPEIVGEFLMSINLLPGAHKSECPRFRTF